MTTPSNTALPLFAWLSPGFPVGAYAYSHALEWAAETGDVRDEETLRGWIHDLVEHGAGRNDAILFAAAYRAADNDPAAFAQVNELALALAPSGELRLETAQQGRSFLDAVLAAWPAPILEDHATRTGEIAYPVAVALASAAHRVPLGKALCAFLYAFVQNLVSAAIRLAPIGQTAGMRVVAGTMALTTAIAEGAMSSDLDDIGSATLRSDLGSFLHETQYTRLFRS